MSLLATKFLPPPPSSHWVVRTRLINQFGARGQTRLTLLVAPAGFGKTTTVQQWLEKQDRPWAWWSLDRMDNSPARFLAYLCAVVEQASGLELPMLKPEPDTDSLLPAITALINALHEGERSELILVLDDAHCLNHPKIMEALTYWVDYAPSGSQLCLTARTELALPLPRWKVKRFASVLYAADLLFNAAETRAYCEERGLPHPTEAFVEGLQAKTRGWIAALHLALDRSLEGRETSLLTQPLTEVSSDISEYMAAEVFSELDPEVQQFVLDVYPLKRFDASLCDHIRGATDSHKLIQTLVARDLFVIPLDDQNHWYRLHELFRETAELVLRQQGLPYPSSERIADALIQRGLLLDALELLADNQSWPALAKSSLLVGPDLISQGFHGSLLDCLERLPDNLRREQPRLLVLQAWCLVYDNRFSALPELVRRIHLAFGGAVKEQALAVELELLDAYVERQEHHFDRAIDLTRSALSRLDRTDIPLKSLAYFNLGTDLYRQGDLAGAADMLKQAINQGKLEQRFATVLSSVGLLVWIHHVRGDFIEGINQYRSILTWVASFHPEGETPDIISCWLNSALVLIHTAQGKLTTAHSFLMPMLRFLEGAEPLQRILTWYVEAEWSRHSGDLPRARDRLLLASQLLEKQNQEVLTLAPPLTVALLKARLEAGEDLSDMPVLKPHHPFWQLETRVLETRLALKRGDETAAQASITALNDLALAIKAHRYQALAESLQCILLVRQGQPEAAVQHLENALLLGESNDYVSLFHPFAEEIGKILDRIPPDRISEEYLGHIRSSDYSPTQKVDHEQSLSMEALATETISPAPLEELPDGVEALSRREMEVLQLIEQGHPNKVIAQKLHLSPATIKAHLRNINSKLGAHNRTEALAIARKLGFLSN